MVRYERLALGAILIAAVLSPVLVQSAFAASPPTILLTVVDSTGSKVAGAFCVVFVGSPFHATLVVTNSGGQAQITVASTETLGQIFCNSAAGNGGSGVFTINPNGVTQVTVTVT
jgi:hypothetical protein